MHREQNAFPFNQRFVMRRATNNVSDNKNEIATFVGNWNGCWEQTNRRNEMRENKDVISDNNKIGWEREGGGG